MKKLGVVFILLLGCVTAALAQSPIYPVITTASAVINISSATTTKLVSGITGQRIYPTAISVDVAGANVLTFEYGTGTNCGTGTTAITGPYTLTSGVPLHIGSGSAPVLIIPPGNDLCVVTAATAAAGGFVAYAQF
jgi:hypothetical protein